MALHVRWLALSAAILTPACTASTEAPATAEDPGTAGGKADGFDEDLCPSDVGINDAGGSQRRCYDPDNGQFVPTACCASLCDGAFWREQANGSACAWGDDPGDPSAQPGQFAPRMCCELNEALACAGAQTIDGACQDPQTGAMLDAICCETQEPAGNCHPLVATELRTCVQQLLQDEAQDPELPPRSAVDALEVCANEGDLTGPIFDTLCGFDPDLPFCELPFEVFHQEVVGTCAQELRPELDCVFGQTYRDLHGNPNIAFARQDVLTLADAAGLSPTEQEQILIAVRQSAFDDVGSIETAFELVDGGEINVTDVFEHSNARAYTVYEYGAGDNGFGAFFEHGTTDLAARILDSDLYDDSDPAQLGCRIPRGPAGQNCTSTADCPEGMSCQGRIDDHPAFGEVGRCVDTDQGQETGLSGNDCETHDDCDVAAGLLCSGQESLDFGFCRPAWMFGQFEDPATVPIPDGGVLERDIFVYGLATVPEDALIDLLVTHPDPSQLQITLIPAMRDEGSLATIWDGAPTGNGEILLDDAPVFHPGDESLNGHWTLRIQDTEPGGEGTLAGWGLRFSSRFD